MSDIGTLVTRVYTSRTQLPIVDATVTILQRTNTEKLHLLGVRITDRNGKTASVAIETPDIDESLAPGLPDGYTLCDVWAEHPDYQIMEIRNVQVFPGIESVQEIPMIPLTRSQSNFVDTKTVDLPKPEL